MDKMKIIADKISELKSLDKTFSVFGAYAHKYLFNHKISLNEIEDFEKEHQITLPTDYRDFILTFGNGGCGPDYGILTLKTGILDIPHYPSESDLIKLSNEFRFNTFWDLEYSPEDDFESWQNEYENSKWCDGMLRICHQGCGIFLNLVITGNERGNIWVDDRANDGGIYPYNFHLGKDKTDFFNWYIDWINKSLEFLKNKGDNAF